MRFSWADGGAGHPFQVWVEVFFFLCLSHLLRHARPHDGGGVFCFEPVCVIVSDDWLGCLSKVGKASQVSVVVEQQFVNVVLFAMCFKGGKDGVVAAQLLHEVVVGMVKLDIAIHLCNGLVECFKGVLEESGFDLLFGVKLFIGNPAQDVGDLLF